MCVCLVIPFLVWSYNVMLMCAIARNCAHLSFANNNFHLMLHRALAHSLIHFLSLECVIWSQLLDCVHSFFFFLASARVYRELVHAACAQSNISLLYERLVSPVLMLQRFEHAFTERCPSSSRRTILGLKKTDYRNTNRSCVPSTLSPLLVERKRTKKDKNINQFQWLWSYHYE